MLTQSCLQLLSGNYLTLQSKNDSDLLNDCLFIDIFVK